MNFKSNLKQEANLSNDVEKSNKANAVINYIEQQVDSYTKNSNLIKYSKSSGYNEIAVNFSDLIVSFRDVPSKGGNLAEFYPAEKNTKNLIKVYNCDITVSPKLTLKFEKSSLFHELIHYFDSKSIKNLQGALYASQEAGEKGDYSSYINSPAEFNAHFFHLTMPEILKIISNSETIPNNFNEFRRNISVPGVTKFYNSLDANNKQRFLKRIGSYWTSLKSTNLTDQNGDIDDLKLNSVTNSWLGKLKVALNLNESQIFIQNTTNMKVKDLKEAIKKLINESKSANPNIIKKPIKKRKVFREENNRDEVGQFCMVHLPHKDSTIDEILTTHTLSEFATNPVDMSKVAGVYKNEAAARKLAEELLDHRSAVLGEMKESEIQQKMDEIQGTKALIGATQQYFKLKPNLNEDESNGKLEELNGNLSKLEEELGKLQEEKAEIDAARKGVKVKPKAKAKKK